MKCKLENVLKHRGPIKKVGVLGMGYVGIPSALLFADSPSFEFVWGFQRNSITSGYKIEMLNRGECPIDGKEPGLQDLLKKVIEGKKFKCTADKSKISEVDAITIAVETGFSSTENLEPDFDSLSKALIEIGRYMSPGMLVVVESTITPGTTEGMVKDILEKESGLKAGEDFALVHAPERVMPGRLIQNIREYDRVVGGIDEASTKRAKELYLPVMTKGRIHSMSAKAAELTKTAENAMRDLQIAAVNELALYCEILGVDFYKIRAAIDSLKGDGVSRAVLYPGAGVGGHCLPKDTYHLLRSIRLAERDIDFMDDSRSLFLLSRDINDFMPRHMVHLTLSALESIDKSPDKTVVALLGWAYNHNTDDPRNTPAEPYRNLLLEKGAEVRVHDPFVGSNGDFPIFKDLRKVVENSDVVAILAAHDEYFTLDLDEVKRLLNKTKPIIVDGRNVIDPGTAIQKGFIYRGIGRGDENV